MHNKIPDLGALHQVIESFSNYDKYTGTSDILIEKIHVHGFDNYGRPDNITEKQYIKGVLIPQTKSIETNNGSGYWVKSEYKLVVASPYTIHDGDIVHTPKGKMVALNVTDMSVQGTVSAILTKQSPSDTFVENN